MAEKKWEKMEQCFCSHADMDVSLEAEVIYPMDYLDGQPPQVGAHRCSNMLLCNQFNQGACIWAGTNPDFDPFSE